MRHSTRAVPYDFRQASSLAADQTRELAEYCANLCRALSRMVPESTGLVAHFVLDELLAAGYDEFLDGLPENPIMALCEFVPNSPPLVWQIDASVAFTIMDAMLGGKGSSPFVREGELTTLERTLVDTIAGEFLTTWTHVWPALRAMAPEVTEVRQTTGRLGTESLEQSLMKASIGCTIGETTGTMRVGIPAVGLRELLKHTSGSGSARAHNAALAHESLARLRPVPVSVEVQLARSVMTVGQVRELKVGDLVLLDRGPGDQVEIAVCGIPKFRGISGLVNGRLAVRVTASAID